MTEVIRLLWESGELAAGHIGTPEGLRIPEGVRDVIGQRLNRLSEQCNQALTTASVIGREFDFRLLFWLSGASTEDQLLAVIDEAVGAHLIEGLPGRPEAYRFSHALIQQNLSEELTPSRKVRLHARIAEALEELYGANPQFHAAELAHHFAEAQTVLGADKMVRYCLLAGEQALASHAYEDAVTHIERGLTAREITASGSEAVSQAAPDEEAAALMFGLARAQCGIAGGHQLGEAFGNLSRAFEYYDKSGNVAQAVATAEFPMASPTYRIPGVAELMSRALTLVPSDSHEAGRLLSRYGGVLGSAECDYEGAQEALGQAISIARREGDVPLEMQTLSYAAAVSGQNLHWQECVENGLRAIELATDDENTISDLVSRFWTVMGLLRMGDLDRARPHASVVRDLAEKRSSHRLIASNHFMMVTTLSCLEGDWKVAREYSDRGLEMVPLNPHLLGTRVLLEYETGQVAQGEVYLERLLQTMHQAKPDQRAYVRTSMAIPAIARINAVSNRLEMAEVAAEAVLSQRFVNHGFAISAKAGLALLAVQKGDGSAAEEHYAYLLGQKGTMIWALASTDRLLGLLSQTMGNLAQAAVHFEEALAFCRKAGYRPELAWSCHDYAETLLVGSNRAKAMSLLDEALAISAELGMKPLMERVAGLQAQVESQTTPPPAFPDGLTQREVEVLRLVASGKSNPEIGEELFISPRTVTTHVSNMLNKINAANRAEATAYAVREGLA